MAGWINSLKDVALEAGVRQFLGSKLAEFGKIEHLKIDTKERLVDVEIRLDGEVSPVRVAVRGYQISDRNGVISISAPPGGFSSSRPWLAKVLNSQLVAREFVIPPQYASYAKSLIG